MTLVPADAAASVLHIDPGLIRVWKSRGRLTSYPLVQGRVVVDWAEIVRLAAIHRRRRVGLDIRRRSATMSTVSGRPASPEGSPRKPRRRA